MSDDTTDDFLARRVGAQLRTTRWRAILAASALVGAITGALLAGDTTARIELALALAIAGPVIAFVALSISQSSGATDDFLADWGRSHDLRLDVAPELGRGTPLLREGDVQVAENGFSGQLAGHPMLLCHYTYTVIVQAEDSYHADSPFTLVRVRDLRSPIARLTLHPVAGLPRAWRKHGPAVKDDRIVDLESVALNRDYRLEVQRAVSDVTVRELFEPTFIDWCVEEGDVLFEIEHRELVVAVRDHLTDPVFLDALLDRTRAILERVEGATDG